MLKFEGAPWAGAQSRVGCFSNSQRYISEMVRNRAQVTIITDRKSIMGFLLQHKSMTLNNLERQFTALSSFIW